MTARDATTWDIGKRRSHERLRSDIESDVAVVGGGIAGVLCAYLLAKEGLDVVLLESDRIGQGVTRRTTAFVTPLVDLPLADLIRGYGLKGAKSVIDSGNAGMKLLQDLIAEEGIDAEWVPCPLYLYEPAGGDGKALGKEAAAAGRLGLTSRLRPEKRLPFPNAGSLEFPRQAKFHPELFLQALAQRCADAGVRIFERSEAQSVSKSGPVRVRTQQGSVMAKHVIVATHLPFNRPRKLFLRTAAYRSYVLEARIPKDALPEALFLDTANPYHYVRVDAGKGHDRLIIGGEDHRQDIPVGAKRSFAALERALSNLLPGIPYEIVRRWPGPILESIDGLPYIGSYAPDRFFATAFSGNGMTFAAVSALLLRDAILGRENPWEHLYRLGRIPTASQFIVAGKHFGGELLGGAVKNILGIHR